MSTKLWEKLSFYDNSMKYGNAILVVITCLLKQCLTALYVQWEILLIFRFGCHFWHSGTPLHGYPLKTDNSSWRAVFLVSHYIFSKFNPLNTQPVIADQGHLFLAQLDRFPYKVNVANVETSSSNVCCNRPLLFQGKCFQRLTVHQAWFVDVDFIPFNHQTSYVGNVFD